MAIICVIILIVGIFNYESPIHDDNERYSHEEIDYFMEIGFAPNERINKWSNSFISVKIIGPYTSDDLNSLNETVNEINSAKGVQMKFDYQNTIEPDIEVYFTPRSEFNAYGADNPESVGACWVWAYQDGRIYKSKIIIPSDQIYQEMRSRIILHELGHSLGLGDSYKNRNSIFYYRLQDRSEYAETDKVMMRILYREDILPGMSKNEVEAVLNRSKRTFF